MKLRAKRDTEVIIGDSQRKYHEVIAKDTIEIRMDDFEVVDDPVVELGKRIREYDKPSTPEPEEYPDKPTLSWVLGHDPSTPEPIEKLDIAGESILKEQEWRLSGFHVKDASNDVIEDKINQLVDAINKLNKEL